jgi:uncharacterized protein YbbK (DUF523 family)
MEKILVSGCLIGQKVRYHGGDALLDHPIFKKWIFEKRIISTCPEVSANLTTPRPSSEIIGGNGAHVLLGKAKVFTHTGIDRTSEFIQGAKNALCLAKIHNIKMAILKKNSPSCGNKSIYDGTYSSNIIAGIGVTAALLDENGIAIFNEDEIILADDYLTKLESNQ